MQSLALATWPCRLGGSARLYEGGRIRVKKDRREAGAVNKGGSSAESVGDSGPGMSPGFALVRVAHHLRPAMRGGRIPLAARSPDSGERPGGKGNARGRGFEAREGRRPGGSWPDRSPGDRPDPTTSDRLSGPILRGSDDPGHLGPSHRTDLRGTAGPRPLRSASGGPKPPALRWKANAREAPSLHTRRFHGPGPTGACSWT